MAEPGEGAGGTVGTMAALGTVLGSAVTGAANLASSIYSVYQNKKLWQMQNEYNTPRKQMERYRAAGLNPNLIYGTGQASAGNAGAIAPYQGVKVSTNDILTMAQAIGALRVQNSEVKLKEAEATGQNLSNYYQNVRNMYADERFALDNELSRLDTELKDNQITMYQYDVMVKEALATYYDSVSALNDANRENIPILNEISKGRLINDVVRTNWEMSEDNPLNQLRTAEEGEVHPNAVAGRFGKYADAVAKLLGTGFIGLKGSKLWKKAGKFLKNIGKRPANVIKL